MTGAQVLGAVPHSLVVDVRVHTGPCPILVLGLSVGFLRAPVRCFHDTVDDALDKVGMALLERFSDPQCPRTVDERVVVNLGQASRHAACFEAERCLDGAVHIACGERCNAVIPNLADDPKLLFRLLESALFKEAVQRQLPRGSLLHGQGLALQVCDAFLHRRRQAR